MSKRESKKTRNVPDTYVVKTRKQDKIVDGIMMFLTLAVSALVINLLVGLFTTPFGPNTVLRMIIGFVSLPVFLFLGLWYYPRYIFEKIVVEGDKITFYRLLFRKHEMTFKDIKEVYANTRKGIKLFQGSGGFAMVINYGKGKFKIATEFTEGWDILSKDLKYHGIAIMR